MTATSLEMFKDAYIIIFWISLAEYEEFFEYDDEILTNKMIANKNLFEM